MHDRKCIPVDLFEVLIGVLMCQHIAIDVAYLWRCRPRGLTLCHALVIHDMIVKQEV